MKNTNKLIFVLLAVSIVLLSTTTLFAEKLETKNTKIVQNSVQNVQNLAEEYSEDVTETENESQTNKNTFTVTATAYCSCSLCCGKSDGITATGTKATQGRTVAVDPKYIPYGTKIIIDGNVYIAEDCGGAVKGENRIDIFFNSHEDALLFGVQTKTVYILEE